MDKKMMICGLFSSFDPGVLLVSKSFVSLKWVELTVLLFFLFWQTLSLSSSSGIFLKKIFFFIFSSVSDVFSNPKSSFLLLLGVFMSVFFMNVWGLVPLFFSTSSHLSINLSLSLTLWVSGILFSLFHAFSHLLAHMVPLGSPSFLWPLLVVVESVSIVIRPFTLSIRLMANVMAGHLIMSLMGQAFASSESMMIPFSLMILGFFLLFEMCISGVQAYVFMSLLSLYWKESEH